VTAEVRGAERRAGVSVEDTDKHSNGSRAGTTGLDVHFEFLLGPILQTVGTAPIQHIESASSGFASSLW